MAPRYSEGDQPPPYEGDQPPPYEGDQPPPYEGDQPPPYKKIPDAVFVGRALVALRSRRGTSPLPTILGLPGCLVAQLPDCQIA